MCLGEFLTAKLPVSEMCGWLEIPYILEGHISSNGPVSVAMLAFRNVYGGGSVQEGDF